jgi:hypothetical protein
MFRALGVDIFVVATIFEKQEKSQTAKSKDHRRRYRVVDRNLSSGEELPYRGVHSGAAKEGRLSRGGVRQSIAFVLEGCFPASRLRSAQVTGCGRDLARRFAQSFPLCCTVSVAARCSSLGRAQAL